MQNRKKRNLEIERRRTQQRRITSAIVLLVCVAIAALLVWMVWDWQNRRWIMEFEGQRISTNDFRFISLDTILTDENRPLLLNTLVELLTILHHGELHGVGATEEEMEENLALAQSQRAFMEEQFPGALRFISDRRMAELFASMQVSERLMDIYAPYEPEPEEMEQARQEFIEMHGLEFTEMHVRYFISDDPDDEPQFDGETMNLFELFEMYELWDNMETLFSLEVGEVSRIIWMDDGQFLWVQMARHDLNEEAIEDAFLMNWESRVMEIRGEIFNEVLQGWVEDADFTVNERALNRV